MAEPWTPLVTRFGGGLNLVDAPDALAPDEARVLEGFELSAGHITTRQAARALSGGFAGTPLRLVPFSGQAGVGAVLLTLSGGGVNLYTVSPAGAVAGPVGTLAGWGGLGSAPVVHCAELARCLFICDEGQSEGLTIYDPNGALGATLFQPTFDFTLEGASWLPMLPRFVVEHANHLFAFGYADSVETDHPEFMRFSYLGLAADDHGLGDAGTGGAAGSEGIFDAEDAAPVGTRGIPVVCAASAGDYMVLATTLRAGVLVGSSFEDFRMRWWDGQFGAASSRAMCVARGHVYWLTPNGDLVRSADGGAPEVLTRKVRPRVAEMNVGTLFLAHAEEKHQVRLYYARKDDATPVPDRYLAWDYEAEQFLEDVLGYRCYTGGEIRPAPIVGPSSEGPAAAPSNLAHDQITTNSARATWTCGEARPGAQTRIYLAQDAAGGANATAPGAYQYQTSVGAGVGAYVQGPLQAGKCYWTKVEHIYNGHVSAAIEGSFVTNAYGNPAAPYALGAIDSPVWVEPGMLQAPSALLSWDLGETGVIILVERAPDAAGAPGAWVGIESPTTVDATSWRDQDRALTVGTWWYRIYAHSQVSGLDSLPTTPVSVALTAINGYE